MSVGLWGISSHHVCTTSLGWSELTVPTCHLSVLCCSPLALFCQSEGKCGVKSPPA